MLIYLFLRHRSLAVTTSAVGARDEFGAFNGMIALLSLLCFNCNATVRATVMRAVEVRTVHEADVTMFYIHHAHDHVNVARLIPPSVHRLAQHQNS